MKTIIVNCGFCNNPVEKLTKEVARSKRENRKLFCNHSCACSYGLKVSPRKGDTSFLRANNRLDKFSPFRYFVSQAKSDERKRAYGETDLNVEYLESLWNSQNGICPYTKYPMILFKTTKEKNTKATPTRASLDRIDSSKGYIQGNVEFVCLAVNYAKNRFGRQEMLDFFAKT